MEELKTHKGSVDALQSPLRTAVVMYVLNVLSAFRSHEVNVEPSEEICKDIGEP